MLCRACGIAVAPASSTVAAARSLSGSLGMLLPALPIAVLGWGAGGAAVCLQVRPVAGLGRRAGTRGWL
jgi:hypothetical protein